jgi:phosphohistidine phosphatase
MKYLTLIRHAKSSWKEKGQDDFDRPLNERGQRDAPMMGRRLAQARVAPDLIVSSPALRAMTTARIIADAMGYPTSGIVLNKQIYEAELKDLFKVINGFDDHVQHVMLFGHNPGLTELAIYLTVAPIDNLPTCGVMRIALAVESWADVQQGSGKLIEFDYPKKET